MSDDATAGLRRELLDDFYAEADELFAQMRAELETLARRSGDAPADRAALERLYRTAHTFKGNCGIVGLRVAEQLAHAAEDVLRSLSRGEAELASGAVDLFARAVQRLEELVSAHQRAQPLPAIDDILGALEAFRSAAPALGNTATHNASTAAQHASASAAARASSAAPSPSAAAATTSTARRWHAAFAPSAELAARGVDVTRIRTRFAQLGTIVSATPVVHADGTMAFEFVLALDTAPADLAAWKADGVTFSADRDAVAAAEGAPPSSDLPAEPTAFTAPATPAAPAHIVRVDLARLDELMRLMGEMVIHRSQLEERIAQLPGDRSGLQEVNLALTRSLRDLRAAITRVRLVSIAEIFSRLPFAVRDLERESGRKVRLVLEGEDTEIDKYLVERLKEPLLHLVRNAVSHGIETPAERRAAGKPDEATLLLRASAAGNRVTIQIRDDGRGIDAGLIAARAAELGLAMPESPTDADVLAVLCQPGFSTRDEADLTSGRGVGMSVVQTTVRELGGLLTLETAIGRHTQFSLTLPLTLSIAETVIVTSGSQTCAVPQGFVEEIVQFEESDVRTVKQTEVIPYRDGLLPLVRLSRMLGAPARTRVRIPALVVTSERGSAGLAVDRVIAQREVVVRPMSDPLLQVPGISAATELGDGRPVLILDPAALTSGAVRPVRGESFPVNS